MAQSEKKKKTSVIRGILSGVLLVYIIFGCILSDRMFAKEKVRNINVEIETGDNGFVNRDNVLSDLKHIPTDSTLLKEVNLSQMEHFLKNMVNIEDATVTRTTEGDIHISITPMIPVARVFDRDNYSYYINREGKKLRADIKYHVDVPIVTGNVDDGVVSAVDLLPIMQYVNDDPLWNSFTSAFKVDENHDVLLIPMIKGHVVNLGNPADRNLEDKFNRLATIYKEVIPNKGWDNYDTLSVKFAGQVVATKKKKRDPVPDLLFELIDSEEVSIDNMNVNPAE